MKRTLQLFTLFALAISYGQKALPLYEGFNYAAGSNIIGQGGWTNASTSAVTDDALIASTPVWAANILPDYTGESLAFAKSGDDPQLVFTPVPQSGSLFTSFVMKVTSLATGSSGGNPTYINYGISTASGSAPSFFYAFAYSTAPGSNSYAGAVFIRRSSSTATDKFYLGIGASNAVALDTDVVWSPTEFTIGDEIVVAVKYDIDNKVAKMWLNPSTTTAEPANPVVSGVRGGSIKPDRLRINKNNVSTTPFITIDEIRAANNWGEALGAASTLGLSKAEIAGLKVYPNPVSGGRLFINSDNNTEKQVTIYNILGQKKIETTTSSAEAINVSGLSKGFYFLQITEDGKTETKKLIVE